MATCNSLQLVGGCPLLLKVTVPPSVCLSVFLCHLRLETHGMGWIWGWQEGFSVSSRAAAGFFWLCAEYFHCESGPDHSEEEIYRYRYI